jgi:hypothetical protein
MKFFMEIKSQFSCSLCFKLNLHGRILLLYVLIRLLIAFLCRVDKAHFSMKYDLKNFMEAEFARRNLYKQVQKETKS